MPIFCSLIKKNPALNQYLRECCNAHFSWDGYQLGTLPETLTLPPSPKIVTSIRPFVFSYLFYKQICILAKAAYSCRIRYFSNVCTFSYSFVWWDWERWERHIDWLALQGFNLPLVQVGMVRILQHHAGCRINKLYYAGISANDHLAETGPHCRADFSVFYWPTIFGLVTLIFISKFLYYIILYSIYNYILYIYFNLKFYINFQESHGKPDQIWWTTNTTLAFYTIGTG